MENVQEAIHRLSPEDKKALFDTLLEGDMEVGLDGEGEPKWQIVRMPLVFKAGAFGKMMGGKATVGAEGQI